MGSALLDSVADAARKVEESLGRLIEVELRRQTGDRDPVPRDCGASPPP